MAHMQTSNEAERPGGPPDAVKGAALIHVPASAQQDPGAIQHCPVCGQLYAAESQPVVGQQAETGASDAQVVFRCAQCKTYSVGALGSAGEEADD